MSAEPKITVDDVDGNLLVGIDGDGVSASACLDADADEDDVSEALADLESELRHSARINGRRSA